MYESLSIHLHKLYSNMILRDWIHENDLLDGFTSIYFYILNNSLMKYIIGIDVSKNTLDIYNSFLGEYITLKNNYEDIYSFFESLDAKQFTVFYESTWVYSSKLILCLINSILTPIKFILLPYIIFLYELLIETKLIK